MTSLWRHSRLTYYDLGPNLLTQGVELLAGEEWQVSKRNSQYFRSYLRKTTGGALCPPPPAGRGLTPWPFKVPRTLKFWFFSEKMSYICSKWWCTLCLIYLTRWPRTEVIKSPIFQTFTARSNFFPGARRSFLSMVKANILGVIEEQMSKGDFIFSRIHRWGLIGT